MGHRRKLDDFIDESRASQGAPVHRAQQRRDQRVIAGQHGEKRFEQAKVAVIEQIDLAVVHRLVDELHRGAQRKQRNCDIQKCESSPKELDSEALRR